MNPDVLAPGERCASTSNRNFEGRQGRGGRTHLVSPQMAAAAALHGHFVDVRALDARAGARMKPVRVVDRPRRGDRPARRRHRPDHPEAVPQADRAHRVRRVPLLRLALRRGRRRAARVRAQPARSSAARRVLLAGRNFGCGSSREHAAWALQDYGFEAIVAPSFGDIFRTNAGKIGLLAIALPEDEVERLMESVDLDTGSEMTVDLERRVVVAPDGREVPFEFDEATRHRLLNGLDEIAPHAAARGRDRRVRDRARHRVTHVAVLPGDGIGPEVAAEAIRVLDALGIEHSEHPFGGNAILARGTPLPGRDARGVPRGRRGPARRRRAARARGKAGAARAGPPRRCGRSSASTRTSGRRGARAASTS